MATPSPTPLPQSPANRKDASGKPPRSTDVERMDAMGHLAGLVAHDFNNLLTVMMGHTEMLLESLDEPGPARDSALEIRNAAETAAAITSQLLAVSGRQALSASVIDLNDVVRNLAETLHQLAGTAIDLRFDLAPELPRLKSDAAQLERVLRNLVLDAREAMPTGGRITISTNRNDERREIVMTMADSRTPAPTDCPGRSFEPTVRYANTPRGSGLNRAAAYGIVKQSGGRISLDCPAGGGVTFTICLPAARS